MTKRIGRILLYHAWERRYEISAEVNLSIGTVNELKMLPEDEITARIETVLYSSGRPLSLDEIVMASGISSRTRVTRILLTLIDKTKSIFRS